jgi:hypothetical protein
MDTDPVNWVSGGYKVYKVSRFEHESQKKSRRCRGLGLDSGLDLAISRFIYSFVTNQQIPKQKISCSDMRTFSPKR